MPALTGTIAMTEWSHDLKKSYLLMKARGFEKLGAWPSAIATYREYLADFPEDVPTVRHLAAILGANGDSRGRFELLEKLAKLTPDDLALLHEVGENHLATGNYSRALPIFERLHGRRPDDPKVLTALGEIHVKLNQPEKAREQFLALLDRCRDRNALRWLFKIGQMFLINRRVDQALVTYHGILKVLPDDGAAQLALSRLAYAGGDLEEALRRFEQMKAGMADLAGMEPKLRQAVRLRDAALSELILEGTAADPPERVAVSTADGTIYARVPDDFRRTVKPVYSLEEQRALRRELVHTYMREGQLDRALFHLTHFRPGDPREQSTVSAQRGFVLSRKGDLDLAQQELDHVVFELMGSPSPAELELLYQVGLVYLHCGRAPRALAAFKRILLFDVDYKDAASLVDRLRSANVSELTRSPDLDQTKVLGGGAPQDASQPAPAQVLGRYQVDELIRQGFLGELFLGSDPTLGRKVVLRKLAQAIVRDRSVRERFVTAAREATQLSHPNLAAVLDIVESTGEVWIVTEWVPGTDSGRLVKDGKPLGPTWVVGLGVQAAKAMAHVHARGILHRDLKGSDFHVDLDSRTLRILDVGLAGISNTMEVAPADYLQRRCDYMPPEFILGERVDDRGDVYSIGMFLYLLAAGRTPFDDGDLHLRLHRYLTASVPPIRQLVADFPAHLEAVILRCLSRSRTDRPRAAELAEMLAAQPGGA